MMTAGQIAVVFGAGGGIGRAFCDLLAAEPRWAAVVGVARRRPLDWPDDPRRPFLAADALDETALAAVAEAVRALGAPELVLVATGRLHGQGLSPEKAMRSLSADSLLRLYQDNAIAPALIAKHLLPTTPRDGRSVFAALSARVGSIGDNRLGGWHGYRASKAALNMMIRCLAIEHARTRPEGLCVALHPGTVATGLSAPFRGAGEGVFTPEESATRLLAVLRSLGPEATGGFFAWDGAPIPW